MNSETHNTHISTVAQTEAPAQKAEEGGLLTINGTLFVIVVSFVFFAILMQRILYGPISQIKHRRNEYIKKMKTEANEAHLEAENLTKTYQENLKYARKKVSEDTTEHLNEANDQKNKLLETKKQEISEYLNEQKQIIQSEKNEAIDSLRDQVMDYAYNISRKVLGEEVPMAGLSPEIIEKAINNRKN